MAVLVKKEKAELSAIVTKLIMLIYRVRVIFNRLIIGFSSYKDMVIIKQKLNCFCIF